MKTLKNIIIIWFFSSILVVSWILILGNNIYQKGYDKGERMGIERGANAVMKYHKCFNSYGSRYYRDRIFETGFDPQNCDDITWLLQSDTINLHK